MHRFGDRRRVASLRLGTGSRGARRWSCRWRGGGGLRRGSRSGGSAIGPIRTLARRPFGPWGGPFRFLRFVRGVFAGGGRLFFSRFFGGLFRIFLRQGIAYRGWIVFAIACQ